MADTIHLGHPPIDVTLKHSARARRLSLRVSGVDGRVSLTLPKRASMREAQEFLHAKEDWIRKHLSQRPEATIIAPGVAIPIEGHSRLIAETRTRSVKLMDDHLLIPEGADKAGARVRAFLKVLARDRLAEASARYSAVLGRPYAKISIRDTRSRWGSCTSDGNLMYSWRLILAPKQVLDYVAAHEVAHLAEMNHSPAFWAEVAGLMPDYEAPRKWLRVHGGGLHHYQF
ncbi:SprT family zinc-dependent metalloprotease [uncultured Litoreibacter sp.]|uniref:M48 family metallopeptidase n=1 Tax=uncultured Litoreibacter sp. TaxID=1392394 RepID=UPI00261EEE38|nr:SprT family zinc-dependent metalloprotease [uncultured Litoreibacter sp.]